MKRSVVPSHNFEHLACFFPGLLALGVHLLPLNHLDALGIDVAALADGLSPLDRHAYDDLAEFNLADLHLWAAEGIAQTCYLTYADQPTGLGPEIVRMDVDRELGGTRWIDALRAWKKDQDQLNSWWSIRSGQGWGSRYTRPPPGVGDIKPWTSPLSENMTVEAVLRTGSARSKGKPISSYGRDYYIRDPGYLLRPEVRGVLLARGMLTLVISFLLVSQTVESLYILWRTTGNVKWRHRGWEIFQAIQRHAKTDSGYASVDKVHTSAPTLKDSMPRCVPRGRL